MTRAFVSFTCAALLLGCAATTVPRELVSARLAYSNASAGPAATLAPADLHKAHEALAEAEKSFSKDANSFQTRDLAYVAQRRAEMAGAVASIAMEQKRQAQADTDYQLTQGNALAAKSQDLRDARAELVISERKGQATAEQLSAEQKARLAAEMETAEARAAIAKLAEIKDDERGMVLTLSGEVLFRPNEAVLMPGAESRLDQVVEALSPMRDRNVVVESYTDSQGSETYNLDLSQRRADVVRDYLLRGGYPAARVQSRGFGEASPIADNATSEGRMSNHRIELVVQRADHP